MIRIIYYALALLLSVVVSARPHTGGITTDQNQQQTFLINSQRKWNAQDYNNYVYNIRRECDVCCWTNRCAGLDYPWRVQINSDWRTPKSYNNREQPVYGGWTMERIFAEIQAALSNPNQLVDATYNLTDGYPTHYSIQTGRWPSPTAYGTTVLAPLTILFSSQTSIFLTHQNLWARERKTSYDYEYFDKGPNPQQWAFPLTVQVRAAVVSSARDRNGNAINLERMTNPPITLDDYFNEISVQLDANAPYVENTYNGALGYPTKVFILGATGTSSDTNVEITNYQVENIV